MDFIPAGTNTATTDCTTYIQAAINALSSTGGVVDFPPGFYKISAAITVSSPGIKLRGSGVTSTYIVQYTPDTDGILFAPSTAGVTAAYLSAPAIENINVVANVAAYTTGTTGAGVRFRQCNGYKLFSASCNNFPEGIVVEGGQLGSLKSFQVNTSAGTLLSNSALLTFKTADYGAGLKQRCFTVQIEDFRLSAGNLRTSCIRIENADGMSFSNGYLAFGDTALATFKHSHDDSYIAAVSFSNVYFDCGPGSTTHAVLLANDSFLNTNNFNIKLGSGCFIGNSSGSAVEVLKSNTMLFSVADCFFVNIDRSAISTTQGLTTLTDWQITSNQFQNCAKVGGIPVLAIGGGRSLVFSDNTISDCGSASSCLQLQGTYKTATITGNSNNTNIEDIGTTAATFDNAFTLSGNSSVFNVGGTSSWSVDVRTNTGSSVTQQTSKTTAVTLNNIEGEIILSNSSLAANTIENFNLINSTIRPNDVILCQRKSGGTGRSYRIYVDSVYNGGCFISIQNLTAGALAESVTIQYKVLRSQIA